MRPKTGHSRTCTWTNLILDFIENKETMEVPGPGKYIEDSSSIMNKSQTSKFRSSSLGSSTIKSKTKRFRTEG